MEDLKKELNKKKKDDLIDIIVALKEKLVNSAKKEVEQKKVNMPYTAVSVIKGKDKMTKVELAFSLESGEAIVTRMKDGLPHLVQHDVMRDITNMSIKQKKVKE